ncbi:ABC transporter ATP-binding protein [Desulfosediminicola sp.]|uniref:ABC transporter ATP-binding protein n=1 Tax=Desulfosediminicola sp. TaxID=2886825 RepID=UPI003AF2362C
MGSIVLKNICKSYNGDLACSDINLTVKDGEFFTFLGPSGCGKTTILRLIAGFIFPDEGTIHLADQEVTSLDAEKRKIGMVFQNYALFPFMTVRQNIEYGLKVQKRAAAEIREKLRYQLEMIGLGGLENRKVNELSGGEQQRVALARSLVVEPRVLLLDEPLSNLDARLRDRMRNELKLLQKKLGITTIFVTHDQREALTMSDRIAVFDHGRCVQVDTPEGIYSRPATSFVAGFVGDTNLLEVNRKDGYWYMENRIRLNADLKPDTRYISIRPQDINISHSAAGSTDHGLIGRIEFREFNGISTDYSIVSGGIRFKTSALNTTLSTGAFEPGDEVTITFTNGSIHELQQ